MRLRQRARPLAQQTGEPLGNERQLARGLAYKAVHPIAVNGVPGFLGHGFNRREFQAGLHHGIPDWGGAAAVGRLLQQRRVDEAGHQGSHLDTHRRPLGIQALGHASHARLGRAVHALVGHAVDRRGAGGVEEAGVGRGGLEVGVAGLRAVEHGAQVHVQQQVQFLGRHFRQRPARRQSGIVRHHIDHPAVGVQGELRQRSVPGLAVGHVEMIPVASPLGQQGRGFGKTLLVAVSDADKPVLAREFLRDGAADARSSAGDENASRHCDLLLSSRPPLALREAKGKASHRPFTCSFPVGICAVDAARTSPSGSARPPMHSARKFSATALKAMLFSGR